MTSKWELSEEDTQYSWELNVPSLFFLVAREGVEEAKQADAELAAWHERMGPQDPLGGEQPDPDISKRYLKGCAAAHVFSAACAEAYVNQVAKTRLGTGEFNSFEKLNVLWRWRILPVLLGNEPFKVGEEPLGGLTRCLELRNALAHCKTTKSEGPKSTAERLGLTLLEAERSVSSTRSALHAMAERVEYPRPTWTASDKWYPLGLVTMSTSSKVRRLKDDGAD